MIDKLSEVTKEHVLDLFGKQHILTGGQTVWVSKHSVARGGGGGVVTPARRMPNPS